MVIIVESKFVWIYILFLMAAGSGVYVKESLIKGAKSKVLIQKIEKDNSKKSYVIIYILILFE